MAKRCSAGEKGERGGLGCLVESELGERVVVAAWGRRCGGRGGGRGGGGSRCLLAPNSNTRNHTCRPETAPTPQGKGRPSEGSLDDRE
eukprot:3494587-Rhodomonas_salina.1